MPPAMEWLLTTKPTFLNELLALPAKEVKQIQKKLSYLVEDPTPDAKTKKRLKGWSGKLHRLRSADYRIFYTYDYPYISVLALRRKGDSTYDEDFEEEVLGGPEAPARAEPVGEEQDWDRWMMEKAEEALEAGKKPLPHAITGELLDDLRVPDTCRETLLAITTEDDLLECATVPEDVLERVIDAVCGRSLDEVARQPDLLLADTEDLLRYKEGELVGFLLKLDPEQEGYVTWALEGGGPTLLKGGPGTGKSTVALYRVREFVRVLRAAGIERPRILFTTYTRALCRFSEQLLTQLLGEDAVLVEVRTADQVAMRIVGQASDESVEMLAPQERAPLLHRALANVALQGNALQVAAQQKTLETLDREYLLEEILGVIEGRGLRTLEEYLETARAGRRVPLGKTQREAVWRVREAFLDAVAATGKKTWEALRAEAVDQVVRDPALATWDAVVVDEVQDLEPVSIRLLVGLAKVANRIFLTADANQSIYGTGFRWTDIHEDLKFRGRTGILRANHRSTREIGEAAGSYLTWGAIEDEPVETRYVNPGPLPAVRAVGDPHDEAALLARFLIGAARELRLGLGACAVLCPYHKSTGRLAAALTEFGLEATAMTGGDLDLARQGVKLLTLKSAKGLEFPIVAVAGFGDGDYPPLPRGLDPAAKEEALMRERRTMFVAMTRAMRALLVIVPPDTENPLLTGFEPSLWNLGDEGKS